MATKIKLKQLEDSTSGYLIQANGSGVGAWVNPNTIALSSFNNDLNTGLTVGTSTITGGTNTNILYNNSGVLGEYSVTGTGTTAVLSTSPTFTTDITTPLIIGGTAVGSALTLKGTSGIGTTATESILFQTGNNGALTSLRIVNDGSVYSKGIGGDIDNTVYGLESGLAFSGTAEGNTFYGYKAGKTNSTGITNTYIGAYVGQNHNGSNNTIVGYLTLSGASQVSGNANTIIGYNTAQGLNTGGSNTIIGANVSGLSAALSNNVILADGAGTVRYRWNGTYNTFTGDVDLGSANAYRIGFGTMMSVSGGNTAQWGAGSSITSHFWYLGGSLKLLLGSSGLIIYNRLQELQGADVASANNLVLGSDGNTFEITGATQVNLISNLTWQNGSKINLLFTSTPTVKHNQATSGTNITIQLAGAADFVASAGDTLTLVLSEIGGTQAWREISRAVI